MEKSAEIDFQSEDSNERELVEKMLQTSGTMTLAETFQETDTLPV